MTCDSLAEVPAGSGTRLVRPKELPTWASWRLSDECCESGERPPRSMRIQRLPRSSAGHCLESGIFSAIGSSSLAPFRQTFSVSKKAFKQALGKLYKSRRISFEKPGIKLLDNSSWKPGV